VLEQASLKGAKIVLPEDFVVVQRTEGSPLEWSAMTLSTPMRMSLTSVRFRFNEFARLLVRRVRFFGSGQWLAGIQFFRRAQ